MLTALARARRHLPLAQRTDAVERLDSERLSIDEVEANLADLARLNRLPGGTRASMAAIRWLAPSADLHLLDVGTGRADMPAAFAAAGWRTTAVDHHPTVLRVARRTTAGVKDVELVAAEATRLPFDDRAFDVAHCSLLLHHLDPPAAVIVLRELRRVARHGVVVNDLRRSAMTVATTWLTCHVLGRSPVTRADGPLSARRAYTVRELDDLLAAAGLQVGRRSGAWMPRVVTAAVPG